VSYHQKLLFAFHYPCEKLAEEGEGRVGDDDVGFVAQGSNFGRAEVAIAFEVVPLQIVDVNTTIGIGVVVKGEDFAFYARLVGIV
jgi:hypothetical protein